jgi:hypothetical protein
MYATLRYNINIFGWARELYQYLEVEETCGIEYIIAEYWFMNKF